MTARERERVATIRERVRAALTDAPTPLWELARRAGVAQASARFALRYCADRWQAEYVRGAGWKRL